MAEYLPLFPDGVAFTRQASASITGGQLVIVSGSGTVAPSSGASSAVVGVAAYDASNGDTVTIFADGVQRVTASGSITAGNTVEAAASGQVAAHTNGTNDYNIIGIALTTVTTGQLVEVQMA